MKEENLLEMVKVHPSVAAAWEYSLQSGIINLPEDTILTLMYDQELKARFLQEIRDALFTGDGPRKEVGDNVQAEVVGNSLHIFLKIEQVGFEVHMLVAPHYWAWREHAMSAMN